MKKEEYINKYEVVTVHKYNVPQEYQKGFIECLKDAIKPDGEVVIHSVESQRVYKTLGYEDMYLIDELRQHFASVTLERRETRNGCDAIVKCSRPIF